MTMDSRDKNQKLSDIPEHYYHAPRHLHHHRLLRCRRHHHHHLPRQPLQHCKVVLQFTIPQLSDVINK